MFDTIGTIEAPLPPRDPRGAKRGRKGGRIGRIIRTLVDAYRWYKEHCTTSWAVVRYLRANREHVHYMAVSPTQKVLWRYEPKEAIRTWKWNASRIVRKFHAETGDIYDYTIQRLR
jgi:hypothetical protein